MLDLGGGEATWAGAPVAEGLHSSFGQRCETRDGTPSQQDEWLKSRYVSAASVSGYHTNIDLTRLNSTRHSSLKTAPFQSNLKSSRGGFISLEIMHHCRWFNQIIIIIINKRSNSPEENPRPLQPRHPNKPEPADREGGGSESCLCVKRLNSEWDDSARLLRPLLHSLLEAACSLSAT